MKTGGGGSAVSMPASSRETILLGFSLFKATPKATLKALAARIARGPYVSHPISISFPAAYPLLHLRQKGCTVDPRIFFFYTYKKLHLQVTN